MSTSLGKSIFEIHLHKVEKLFKEASKQANPALWLFLHDLRTPMFMLEAVARVYEKVYDSKDFAKRKEQFKQLEDTLGSIDYYYFFSKELSQNKKIKSEIIDYLNAQTNAKLKELNKILKEENWLNGKRLKKNKENLDKTEWMTQEEEIEAIREVYVKSIVKLEEFIEETTFTFDHVETDVHELRRRLRWLSIYPQALQGVFQYSPSTSKPSEKLKKYMTANIVKSPYNVLPNTLKVEKPILLEKNYFLALSWTISELGILKDEGLRVLAVKEAIQNISMLKDDKAFVEAYKVLGKTQMSIETILAKAQSISKSFFNEKNLDHLLAK